VVEVGASFVADEQPAGAENSVMSRFVALERTGSIAVFGGRESGVPATWRCEVVANANAERGCSKLAAMRGLERLGTDRSGRPWFLLDSDELAAWDVAASAGFEQFTAFLALSADRYADQEIIALGENVCGREDWCGSVRGGLSAAVFTTSSTSSTSERSSRVLRERSS
jgi:hypothetical protein